MTVTSSDRVVVLSEDEGGGRDDTDVEDARDGLHARDREDAFKGQAMSTLEESFPVALQVSIPRQELVTGPDAEAYVVYHIRTLTPAATASRAHRYRDFLDLSAKLQEATGLALQALPPKMLTVISRDNSFHEQRRLQLQVWLQAIVADPACTLADELLHFLGVPRADLDVEIQDPLEAEAPSPYHAELVGWEEVKDSGSKHSVYVTRITAVATGRTWFIRRRYRDFHYLHAQLLQRNQRALVCLVPPLPTRMFAAARRFRAHDDRAYKLGAFLRSVVDRYDTFRCPALEDFLELGKP
jgi:hypothetical protein